MMSRLFLIIFLLIPVYHVSVAQNVADYGLRIKSTPSLETEATSLALDGGRYIKLKRRPLSISFSLYNSNERPFGCILRMISDDGYAIDVMNTVDNMGIYRPQIVVGGESIIITTQIKWDEWVNLSLTLDPKKETVLLDYDGTQAEMHSDELKSINQLRISFGNCQFDGFKVNSVASVGIRDIILKSGGEIIRNWPLQKHLVSSSLDTVCYAEATVVNPDWIADSEISLTPVFSKEYPHFVDVAYDGIETFYIIKPDGNITKKSALTGNEEEITHVGGKVPSNAPNQAKWCNDTTLLSYSISQNLYGEFDLNSRQWSNVTTPDPNTIYWNVTSCWDADRSYLYSFGGYGFHHFNNILHIFSPNSPQSSNSVTLNKIAPRFFASSTVLDGSLYIFGGEGSLSGNQGIVEDLFYDLYRVDIDTFEEALIWKADEPAFGKFIPGENLVYDQKEDCFYTTAIVEDDFILVKIDKDAPSIEQMSLPTGVRIDVNMPYSNLYMNNSGDTLYALFLQTCDTGSTKVDVMSIDMPILPVRFVLQEPIPDENKGTSLLISILIGGVVLYGGISYFKIKAGRRRKAQMNLPNTEEYYDFSRNCICLLGGFRVYSRTGEDITSNFSQTLRKLLIALILYTVKYKQGILGESLNQLIWNYKPEGTASNNRNVYISRLRTALEEIDGVKINTKNKFLSISFSNPSICDYVEAMRLFESHETDEDVNRLLSLLFKGKPITNADEEWIEAFTGEYSATALSFLSTMLDSKTMSDNMNLKIADTIVVYDNLNEKAMGIRCNIYHATGNLGVAKDIYDTFCRDYKSTIGEDYNISFKSIISSHQN